MASCLITGGQGFIGSALARNLVESGCEVTVLDRAEPPFPGLEVQGIANDVRVVEGDVASRRDVAVALAGSDRVFHLAAVTLVREAANDPGETYRSNVEGTWTLLEEARKSGLEAIVVASSDKAYGPSPNLPYREEQELLPASPYEGSKAACDVIARSYSRSGDLPVAVTRLANVYGGGDLNFSRLVPELMAAAAGARQPRVRSDGSPRRDFLHLEDAVRGYRAVADLLARGNGAGEAFNLGTGRAVSVQEVIALAAEVTGSELEPLNSEDEGALGEIDEQFVDSGKVAGATGWRAEVGLREGLQEAFEWYSANPDRCP